MNPSRPVCTCPSRPVYTCSIAKVTMFRRPSEIPCRTLLEALFESSSLSRAARRHNGDSVTCREKSRTEGICMLGFCSGSAHDHKNAMLPGRGDTCEGDNRSEILTFVSSFGLRPSVRDRSASTCAGSAHLAPQGDVTMGSFE